MQHEDGFRLSGINLEISRGEIVVLKGRSGSGKTTLLRLIAGLEIPDDGEIHIDGKCVSRAGWAIEPVKRGIGFVFQSPALWPHMTVAGNIMFGIEKGSIIEKQSIMDKITEPLGLDDLTNRYPDSISRGEARRVSIARTLASGPDRVLMDEALTNLDPEINNQTLEFILKVTSESGASLLYVTHDQNDAEIIPGRVITMENGELV